MRSVHRLPLVPALVLSAAAAVHAALPTFWQVSTEADFLRGEFENLAIDAYGRLTLGPTTTPLYEASAPFLWTVVPAPDGSVYVGSGNDGQVFRIDSAGASSVFFDAEELEVHAIALAPGGGIYAATSPDGRIYRIDAKGSASVFFDPGDRYIWSLAVDRAGVVYAGTGDKGVIYRIEPDGTGRPFYETKATHTRSLALDAEGRLLAGTDSPGRVFRIDASGRPFVLLDSSYNEIAKLRVGPGGEIYAVAVSGRSRPAAPAASPGSSSTSSSASTPAVSVSTEITGVSVADSSSSTAGGSTRAASSGAASGAVFRIALDGAWEAIWESSEDTPYDVAFEDGGSLLVSTGGEGKIYRLSGDPLHPTLVARAEAEQVTALASAGNRMLFATSNPGKLFHLGTGRAQNGNYLSDVRDAQTVATWGTISWHASTPGGTRVEISTRSGNTRTPDETWSDWSSPYPDREGSTITSPRARYLQWRAILNGARDAAPLLTSVSAAYLPRNLRPRVTSITVHPPGTVFQRQYPADPEIAGFEGDTPERRALARAQGSSTGVTLGRRGYEKGLLTFVWQADDPNRDTLTYDVLYRREGETAWTPLKEEIADRILVWDTTSVPNGRYVVRVVASDAPSNSPATTLTGSTESTAFDVDNAAPAIAVNGVRRQGGELVVTFGVRDEDSVVQKAEYSLDGNRWVTVYPMDGITDSRAEQFELRLNAETARRGVILRATDALNNVANADVSAPAGASDGR